MEITAFSHAQRYVGQVFERDGDLDHPLIQWWLSLCGFGLDAHDEIPWCSAFVNGIAWDLRLPRSKSAAARSWLTIGRAVPLDRARAAYDVVVLERGSGIQPGADVIEAPGHAGLYAGSEQGGQRVLVLAGNHATGVSVAPFPATRVLGVRRLWEGS